MPCFECALGHDGQIAQSRELQIGQHRGGGKHDIGNRQDDRPFACAGLACELRAGLAHIAVCDQRLGHALAAFGMEHRVAKQTG